MTVETLPAFDKPLWLTSFWGFDPSSWGGLGFTQEADRSAFLRAAPVGSLVAIYVTKAKGPEEMRGKIVGFLEMTHDRAPMQQLTSPLIWASAQRDAGSKNKWSFGISASRAWIIAHEEWQDVEAILPDTYNSHNAQLIGSKGVPVRAHEVGNLSGFTVAEVSVYGQARPISAELGTIRSLLLSPSNAIHPGTGNRWIGEVDGPKYLYILRLAGNYSHFLGRQPSSVDGRHVIKVGFSKSPSIRCRQIQAAYPSCAFEWRIHQPDPIPPEPPFTNAAAAIVGEDAMKKRLVDEGAESLGGEFFLVDDDQLVRVWNAGRFALAARP